MDFNSYRTLGVGNGERGSQVFRVGNGVFDTFDLFRRFVESDVRGGQVVAVALNSAVCQLIRQQDMTFDIVIILYKESNKLP